MKIDLGTEYASFNIAAVIIIRCLLTGWLILNMVKYSSQLCRVQSKASKWKCVRTMLVGMQLENSTSLPVQCQNLVGPFRPNT